MDRDEANISNTMWLVWSCLVYTLTRTHTQATHTNTFLLNIFIIVDGFHHSTTLAGSSIHITEKKTEEAEIQLE